MEVFQSTKLLFPCFTVAILASSFHAMKIIVAKEKVVTILAFEHCNYNVYHSATTFTCITQ